MRLYPRTKNPGIQYTKTHNKISLYMKDKCVSNVHLARRKIKSIRFKYYILFLHFSCQTLNVKIKWGEMEHNWSSIELYWKLENPSIFFIYLSKFEENREIMLKKYTICSLKIHPCGIKKNCSTSKNKLVLNYQSTPFEHYIVL